MNINKYAGLVMNSMQTHMPTHAIIRHVIITHLISSNWHFRHAISALVAVPESKITYAKISQYFFS